MSIYQPLIAIKLSTNIGKNLKALCHDIISGDPVYRPALSKNRMHTKYCRTLLVDIRMPLNDKART